jgi:DNA-binding beta-propeller fold protein YncE
MKRLHSIAMIAVAAAMSSARVVGAQNAGCSAPAKNAIVELEVPGRPFEPVITPDGCWIFVTLTQREGESGGGIAVVRRAEGSLSIARTISLKDAPTGAVLTHDGTLLIVADGGYLAFLDVARLEHGDDDAILGYMGSGSPVRFIFEIVSAVDW